MKKLPMKKLPIKKQYTKIQISNSKLFLGCRRKLSVVEAIGMRAFQNRVQNRVKNRL